MEKYEDALRAGVAKIHSDNNKITFSNWRAYVNSLDIIKKYPGINGIGVIFNVYPDKLDDFLRKQRQAQPNFKIHPAQKRKRYLPITYIVPVKGNEQAVGLDMAFEKNRFNAALKAEITGNPQLTGPIILVQDNEKTPGFLLFSPYYSKPNLVSAKERKDHFIGLVYAPFIMKKLISGTLAQKNRNVVIKITDNDSVLYNKLKPSNAYFDARAPYKKKINVNVYGRTWQFDLWSSVSFTEAATNNQTVAILIGGIIIECLLVMLFLQMAGSKKRALNYAMALHKDLSKQAHIHSTLNKRHKLALRASKMGVWEYHIETQELIWDEFMFSLFGVNKKQFCGTYKAWESVLHPEDKDQSIQALKFAIEHSKRLEMHFRIILPDKKIRVIQALAELEYENGNAKKMIGVNWDITEIKSKEEQLEHLAKFDSLSQLRNRFSFNDCCSALIKRAKKTNQEFALLIIDIDDFKQINDRHGHNTGDKFIAIIADSLKKACRERDLIFRIGGDEFAVLSEFIDDVQNISDMAERMVGDLRKDFLINGHLIKSSCSIGIGIYPRAGKNTDELMTNADIALYKSKEDGKDCINFYTDSLNEKTKRIRFIKNNLVNAADSNEFYMNYQPIVDLRTNTVMAIESLARWSSSIGNISPDEFIPIAEKTNMINQIGKSIVKKVISDLTKNENKFKVSINCSSKQLFQNSGFVECLFNTLKAHNILPKRIILEITETFLINDYAEIVDTLNEIHRRGIDIAIDDFGTGNSSLSLLANIPFQYLKIDKAFIKNIESDAGLKVLKCIVNVSKSLNKKIIAEGIETKEQLEKLKELEVHLIQGYFFAKPSSIDKIPVIFEQP